MMVVGLASRSTGRWRGNKSEVFRPCRGMNVRWDSSFGEGAEVVMLSVEMGRVGMIGRDEIAVECD